ncbi:MAG: aminotransferase class IV, partial [Myxococcales bacterium]
AIAQEVSVALAAAQNPESYLRLIVTRGSGDLGLDPALATDPQRILIVTPLHRPSRETYAKGVKAVTARTHRATDASDAIGAKVGNYLVAVLAMRKAQAAAANEALIVDRDGHVIEGATSNLFWVEAERLCTPPISAGVLEGITRAVVLDVAKELGIEITLDSPSVDRLFAAKEVFITSSIRQMLSVVDIDGHCIADGRPGPIYWRLFEKFLAMVQSAPKE